MQTPPVERQAEWWNHWLLTTRETEVGDVSEDQSRQVIRWADEARVEAGRPLDIIDVGCGGGWLCERLTAFGSVTGTDLADEVMMRAQARRPDVRFVAGDFMALDFPAGGYDVVVTLEVLSHVADQPAFMAKCANLLRPGGLLMIANQNRWVLERNNVRPVGEGQIRKWTTRGELCALMEPCFEMLDLTTLTPRGHNGILRLANSGKVNRLVAPLVGGQERLTRLKERAGLGWTVMARGWKR